MRPFSLLVKPASADCNLECEYCFYLEKQNLYPGVSRHQMRSDILEAMIGSYMRTPQPVYSFGWQGGEPTLMGRTFFERITELQERYAPAGASVSNGLQTNGTLITDRLARHLARYHFLVGISVDGPAELHDRYRHTLSGRGTHREVIRGLERLRRNGVDFNVLTLVSQTNVHRPKEVYRYLRDELGMSYHQYIPCVEFDEKGQLRDFAISGEEWGRFLNGVFDEWVGGDVGKVSIRNFDSVLTMMIDGVANSCVMGKNCRKYFVVEYNGDVYPCDFFVDPEKRLGNVLTDRFTDMWRSERFRAFGLQKKHWNDECDRCEFLKYCAGDCLKNRFRSSEDPHQLSVLCDGWKMFYGHTLEEFRTISSVIRNARSRGEQEFSYVPS